MAGDEPDNKKIKPSADINSMTSKQYLDSMVVPHLLPALNAVSTSRPQDPIQYLVSQQNTLEYPFNYHSLKADYLMKNKKTGDSQESKTEN